MICVAVTVLRFGQQQFKLPTKSNWILYYINAGKLSYHGNKTHLPLPVRYICMTSVWNLGLYASAHQHLQPSAVWASQPDVSQRVWKQQRAVEEDERSSGMFSHVCPSVPSYTFVLLILSLCLRISAVMSPPSFSSAAHPHINSSTNRWENNVHFRVSLPSVLGSLQFPLTVNWTVYLLKVCVFNSPRTFFCVNCSGGEKLFTVSYQKVLNQHWTNESGHGTLTPDCVRCCLYVSQLK